MLKIEQFRPIPSSLVPSLRSSSSIFSIEFGILAVLSRGYEINCSSVTKTFWLSSLPWTLNFGPQKMWGENQIARFTTQWVHESAHYCNLVILYTHPMLYHQQSMLTNRRCVSEAMNACPLSGRNALQKQCQKTSFHEKRCRPTQISGRKKRLCIVSAYEIFETANAVSSVINTVATSFPQPLQPLASILGADLSEVISFQPTGGGLTRLFVSPILPDPNPKGQPHYPVSTLNSSCYVLYHYLDLQMIRVALSLSDDNHLT